MKIRTTYDIVTEESSRSRDCAEAGWEDEEGEYFECWEDAARFLSTLGPLETSSCPWQSGSWYTEIDSELDEKRFSYHLVDFSCEEEFNVYQWLRVRGSAYA